MLIRNLGLGLAFLTVAGAAQAAPISSLFSTGVDASGNVLANGTVGDPHYAMASNPGGTSDIRVLTSANGFPIGPWLGDNSVSRWIGPNSDGSVDGPSGSYDYRTTFSLAGLSAATASITGQWSADNEGLDILLNGVSTGNATGGGSSGAFTQFTAFTLASGFIAGANTLDFLVNNDGGPTGVRVEMTGTASASAVPEPAALAILGVGLTALAFVRRRTV